MRKRNHNKIIESHNPNRSKKLRSRRDFLRKSASAIGIASASVWFNHPVLAQMLDTPKHTVQSNLGNKKLVWVFLRGAMDGLHAVAPRNNAYLSKVRPHLYSEIEPELLPLDTQFGLHPSFKHLHALYRQKQMSPIIAVASAYRERSHFDAQDQMESGLNRTDHDSGWLARAMLESTNLALGLKTNETDMMRRTSAHSASKPNGFALSRSLPIAMRGNSASIETWYPSTLPEASSDLLSQLEDIYQDDDALRSSLAKVIKQKQTPGMQLKEETRPKFGYLAQRCAELLRNNNASCAMLELNGWDTHNNQVSRLNRMFSELDEGLQSMQQALANDWKDTLVFVSTEFGRTVAANGTNGTDHGTASTMFVLGGALEELQGPLAGGKVLGKWPGLAADKLYEKRDLLPTTDVRQWFASALRSHWQLPASGIKRIFPDL